MISLCMIVKNEEHNLARCLNSAKDCVDEIIIVDTGSEDRTVAIAQDFGAKIFHYQWNEDFAAARNFSLDQATGDWLLYLDADEELESGCAERLRALTQQPQAEAYIFQIINLTDCNDPLKHVNVRMFRNKPEYRFEGKLHEQIITAITPRPTGSPVYYAGINILHYGYLAAEFVAKNKAQRNHRINMKLVEQDPNNPFYLYSLGGSCINLGDQEGAIANYLRALQHVNLRAMYAPSIFVSLISCLLKMGRLEEAVDYLEQSQKHYPDYVDVHFIEGELFSQLGHQQRAIKAFEKCLALGEQKNGRYTSRTGVGTFLAHFKLAEIYHALGDDQLALQQQILGLKLKNNEMKQYVTLAQILKSTLSDNQQVYEILKKNIKHANKNTEKFMLARLLYEIEEYQLAAALLEDLPPEKAELPYYQSMSYIKCGQFSKALGPLAAIQDQNAQEKAVQELVLTLWTSRPARDAAPYLKQISFIEEELFLHLQSVNEVIFNRQPQMELNSQNYYFNELINLLLNRKSYEKAHQLLTHCHLATPADKVNFLIQEPLDEGRFDLAARLALQEIKKGTRVSQYYYALSRYFYNNQEYDSAQSMLHQALELNPQMQTYLSLLTGIHTKQSLAMVLEALKHYPDHPEFNKQLLFLQQRCKTNTRLQGVH